MTPAMAIRLGDEVHTLDPLVGVAVIGRDSAAAVRLTPRQREVLATVVRLDSRKCAALELHISISTVKFHLASLMTKLAARNRVELAMWAYETKRVR